MALTYIVPLLVVLQMVATLPTETSTESSTDLTLSSNATSPFDFDINDLSASDNQTSDNDTTLGPLPVEDEVNSTVLSTSEEDNEVVTRLPYSPYTDADTEAPAPNPPTEKPKDKNLATVLSQPGMLILFLPICVRFLTSRNWCL